MVGVALAIITEEALVEVGALKWNPDNKRVVKEFNRRWDDMNLVLAKTTSRSRNRSAAPFARSSATPRYQSGARR
ncbi:hypothetical protein [Bradyrhizobium lablabi]|uniref:hypothetical protein n=1 Tax=Bradyrhizobium lablabi TaxID=722472 RepID=UPI001BAB38A3|nr:hypothetical protein [Bradyrhizobium lablabi]MBR0694280.1 hypothetical protein [Bradyrhizobium lablabi]